MASAQTASPIHEGPQNPQQLLEKAILTLEARRSVSAKVRHRVDLFGKSLVGSGSYLQQRAPEGLLLRLELKIQAGSQITSLLQVCDGQHLWTYRKGAQDQGSLSRVAIVRVAQALEEAGEMPEPGKVGRWLGLGGLPRLLRELNAAFQFVAAEDTKLDQRPVWKLRGRWKPEKLARFLPPPDKARPGEPIDFRALPRHLPDQVFVYLDKENLLPLQLEYRRSTPSTEGQNVPPEDRVIVAMELFEPVFNAPIDPTRFIYNPGTQEFTDQTEAYLQDLKLKK